MLDTNVLISALLFSNSRMNRMMECILSDHSLVLSSYVVWELKDVIKRKFPDKILVIDTMLSKMIYEYAYTPEEIDTTMFKIRDTNDYPVLYTAISTNVDILITGDKDFECIEIDRPEIMTPAEFVSIYCDI